MKYFKGINRLEELKAEYKRLVKANHPDLGGTHEAMVQINNEYEAMLKLVINSHGEKLNIDDLEVEKAIMEVIQRLITISGLTIELCGRWVWISGDTKKHKELLKAVGCFFARKKLCWYWRPADENYKRHKPQPMSKIRLRYGSKVFQGQVADALPAG